ncbi:hypothetical protein [Paracidovorax citrulli]|uniref:hypothetical protein n=1 Tax=Paracidovorax citrulli TaxID=80869 RepID=UPI0005FC12E2|nr:hypothetical protein [Paracidovorax citrulli]
MSDDLKPHTAAASTTGAVFRDAFRLLCILLEGSAIAAEGGSVEGFDRVFRGQKRAQALVFYVCYPDYLADRLLDLHDAGQPGIMQQVEKIFAEEEPSVRLVKMIRWQRGAYFDLDNSLAILSFYELIRPVERTLPNLGSQHDYLIGAKAAKFVQEAIEKQPGLAWYLERARLAMDVSGLKSGHALKAEQYKFEEYVGTKHSVVIPSIADQVRKRFETIKAKGQQ